MEEEKVFDKIHHYENFHKTRNKGESQFDKVHLQKNPPTVNIILNDEKLDTFPISSGTRKVFEKQPSHHSYSISYWKF